jgi:glycosyltransferase involved in cell wall biosynthesis
VESKGIAELLAAVSSLPQKILDSIVLLIIGNVETRSIGKALNKLKKESWMMHRPPVDRDEIKSYYCAADAFVLPSYYEGISSSLIEAMACRLPPIVTNVGGNVEVVKNMQNGLIVEAKDVTGLKNSIERLIQNNDDRKKMAGAARNTVVQQFNLNKKADSYIQLYNKVML